MRWFASIFSIICFLSVSSVRCPLDFAKAAELKELLRQACCSEYVFLSAFLEKINTDMRYDDLAKELKLLERKLDEAGGRRSYEMIEFLTACTMAIKRFQEPDSLRPFRRHTI